MKTTKNDINSDFYISEYERRFALQFIDSGYDSEIYYVSNLKDNVPKCFIISSESVEKILTPLVLDINNYLVLCSYKVDVSYIIKNKKDDEIIDQVIKKKLSSLMLLN